MPKQQQSSLDNVRPLMQERAELWSMVNEANKRIKEIDKELKPVLMDKGAITYGGYVHEVSSVKGRTTYDVARMINDYSINEETYKRTGKPSAKYTITKVTEA